MSAPTKGEEMEERKRMKDNSSEQFEGREQPSISSEQETKADTSQISRTQSSDKPKDTQDRLNSKYP